MGLWEEERGRRGSLLSSDLSRLEPGDKVLDGLVLEVGAHVAGEGPVGVALFWSPESTQRDTERGGREFKVQRSFLATFGSDI